LDLAQVVQSLQEMGYERVSKVETPGEFSVRGGILDVFPVTVEEPFRVDLFDDEVDSIRRFEPASQRSKEEVDFLLLGPAREFLFEKERVEEAVEAMTDAATRQAARLERDRKSTRLNSSHVKI